MITKSKIKEDILDWLERHPLYLEHWEHIGDIPILIVTVKPVIHNCTSFINSKYRILPGSNFVHPNDYYIQMQQITNTVVTEMLETNQLITCIYYCRPQNSYAPTRISFAEIIMQRAIGTMTSNNDHFSIGIVLNKYDK